MRFNLRERNRLNTTLNREAWETGLLWILLLLYKSAENLLQIHHFSAKDCNLPIILEDLRAIRKLEQSVLVIHQIK